MSLELVQRDFLNVIDEAMDFNEHTLAECLRQVGELVDSGERRFLLGIAAALDNPASEWKLTLTRRTKGRFVPPHLASELHDRRMTMLHLLADAERKGWKTEAAISALAERFSVSRATVFKCIKEAEDYLQSVPNELLGIERFTNPRPVKSGKD